VLGNVKHFLMPLVGHVFSYVSRVELRNANIYDPRYRAGGGFAGRAGPLDVPGLLPKPGSGPKDFGPCYVGPGQKSRALCQACGLQAKWKSIDRAIILYNFKFKIYNGQVGL
jgi:hypothetical protein